MNYRLSGTEELIEATPEQAVALMGLTHCRMVVLDKRGVSA